jgi:hypothetical protein
MGVSFYIDVKDNEKCKEMLRVAAYCSKDC